MVLATESIASWMRGQHSTSRAEFLALPLTKRALLQTCPISATCVKQGGNSRGWVITAPILASRDPSHTVAAMCQRAPRVEVVAVQGLKFYWLCKRKSSKEFEVIPLVVKFTERRNENGGCQDVGTGSVALALVYGTQNSNWRDCR